MEGTGVGTAPFHQSDDLFRLGWHHPQVHLLNSDLQLGWRLECIQYPRPQRIVASKLHELDFQILILPC